MIALHTQWKAPDGSDVKESPVGRGFLLIESKRIGKQEHNMPASGVLHLQIASGKSVMIHDIALDEAGECYETVAIQRDLEDVYDQIGCCTWDDPGNVWVSEGEGVKIVLYTDGKQIRQESAQTVMDRVASWRSL